MLYLRCLQAFSDNLQSCHFPVYHSINSYIFLSKFSNFLVIISLENRLSKNLIIRLFLILFSIILSYYASFAILFISSFASINPRCVYTFNVTDISLERIYGKYRNSFIRYAGKVLSDEFYAEDVVQDVFTGLFQQTNYFVSEMAALKCIYIAKIGRAHV